MSEHNQPRKKGRGKSKKSLDLIEASIRILEEIHPASVRAVCYRLFIDGLIASMSKSNTDSVSKQLVFAREQGLLPWEWIVDETREVERANTWGNPDQIINAAVDGYRRDYWQEQPYRVEVISEKGTVRGTLAPILKAYGVTLRVQHGFGSATSLYNLAEDSRSSDKPLIILYVGDWDPSGMQMSEIDLPARLDRYNGTATIKRIALTAEDVAPGTNLPSFDAKSKSGDSRYNWFTENYGVKCWELDAMSPVDLRRRVESEIRSYLDLDAWQHALDIELAEKDSMRDFMQAWQSISGQADKYSCEGARDE